jgi:hypothetical protein
MAQWRSGSAPKRAGRCQQEESSPKRTGQRLPHRQHEDRQQFANEDLGARHRREPQPFQRALAPLAEG